MEHVRKLDAVEHKNSANCTVYEYPMQNKEMSIGVARVLHRYPERGYALNQECSEMGYIIEGTGQLVTETKKVQLSTGDVIYIPRGENFYWEGNMTIVLPTAPAWHMAQHRIVLPEEMMLKEPCESCN